MIGIGLLLALPVMAQDLPKTLFGTGAVWDSQSSPYQVGGAFQQWNRLGDCTAQSCQGTYEVNKIDVYSRTLNPFTVTYQVTPMVMQKLMTIWKMPVFMGAGVGLAVGAPAPSTAVVPASKTPTVVQTDTGSTNVGYSVPVTVTGMIRYKKSSVYFLPEVRWTKTNLATPSQNAAAVALGLTIAWGSQ